MLEEDQLNNAELEILINSVKRECMEAVERVENDCRFHRENPEHGAPAPVETDEQATAKLRMVSLIDQTVGVINGATDEPRYGTGRRPPVRLSHRDVDHLGELLHEMKEQMEALHGSPIWYRYERASHRNHTYVQDALCDMQAQRTVYPSRGPSTEDLRSLTGGA